MKLKFILTIITAVLLTAGCSQAKEPNSEKVEGEDKINIYSTVYPLEYFANSIGGKYVKVSTVYPPGTDEHTYEPSQKDIIKMTEADLFLYIGHGLEGFVDKADDIFKSENVEMTAVGEKIDIPAVKEEEQHEEDHHHHADVDPHIWIDPELAKQMALVVKDELVNKKPEKKEYFEKNYTELSAKLDQLDSRFRAAVKEADRKEIIVSHAAYGYWENRYGIEQISISGLSSSEPSQKQLKQVVQTAKEHQIKYVFFEQNVSSKLTETIQKEVGAAPLKFHNLSVLTENDIKGKEDYFSLMNKNIAALKTALTK
ncbi:zinc transport system substrate-binding protein [Peribacillus deserti]|uniref:Zinc transport system substrate-binding protein n=1 Tax=Peribacillus deserti TaxID=673318 RepID=A0ABS2QL46_9BACI|nr:zinc ABC transporter substrate-binding protein [Peribacillus deserti]MBM7692981.1 zinc transport system substrate-binding protein [Peribacillus deserti]